MVVKENETLEKQEQLLELRTKVLKAEQERLNGEQTVSITEARIKLQERLRKV